MNTEYFEVRYTNTEYFTVRFTITAEPARIQVLGSMYRAQGPILENYFMKQTKNFAHICLLYLIKLLFIFLTLRLYSIDNNGTYDFYVTYSKLYLW